MPSIPTLSHTLSLHFLHLHLRKMPGDPRDELILELLQKNKELEKQLAEAARSKTDEQQPQAANASSRSSDTVLDLNTCVEALKKLYEDVKKLAELLGVAMDQLPLQGSSPLFAYYM